jgi:hypothetical protein
MKAKLKNNDEKFKPITIELTIESREELNSLWARTNFNSFTDETGYAKGKICCVTQFWELINNLCKEYL